MKTVYCKVLIKTQDSLLQTIEQELRSMGPKFIPLLATRYLYWGVHLTECQCDPKDNPMSRWPDVVLLLATDASTRMYIRLNVSLIQRMTKCQDDLIYYHSWPPDASTRGTSDLSTKRTSENLNSLWIYALLHRGLFYERPIKISAVWYASRC